MNLRVTQLSARPNGRVRVAWVLGAAAALLGIAIDLAQAGGILRGRAVNDGSGEGVQFATVHIQGTTRGAIADEHGTFQIQEVPDGQYKLEVSALGYLPAMRFELEISTTKPLLIEVALDEAAILVDSTVVRASTFHRTSEPPKSSRVIGAAEIERLRGANRDL